MKKQFLIIVILISSYISLWGIEVEPAVNYICQLAKEKNQYEIAVFPFTSIDGEETKEAKKIHQLFITKLLQCKDLTIIDQQKIDKVLEQQAKLQSGLYSDVDDIQLGQLVGAKTLLYGTYDENFLQISLVDTTKGNVIGAYAIDKENKKELSQKQAEEHRKEFKIKKALRYLFHHRPALFVYVVTTDEELQELKKRRPRRYEKFMNLIDHIKNSIKDPQKKEEIEELRKIVHKLRENPKIDTILKQRRKQALKRIRK